MQQSHEKTKPATRGKNEGFNPKQMRKTKQNYAKIREAKRSY